MKYIRTLQNIKKLMNNALINENGYSSENHGYPQYRDYDDDNYHITTAMSKGADPDEIIVTIEIDGMCAKLTYYQNSNGKWELCEEESELENIEEISKRLQQTVKEIEERTLIRLRDIKKIDGVDLFNFLREHDVTEIINGPDLRYYDGLCNEISKVCYLQEEEPEGHGFIDQSSLCLSEEYDEDVYIIDKKEALDLTNYTDEVVIKFNYSNVYFWLPSEKAINTFWVEK